MGNLEPTIPQGTRSLSYNQANIINEFRIIMSRLIYLTRFYITERITGIGNPEATYNEILQIAIDLNQLAQTIPENTAGITTITPEYLVNLLSLIDGMISDDQVLASESIGRLYEISNEYAESLASLSPYWDEATWQSLLNAFNQALVAEILAIQTGDYNQALDIFDGLMHMGLFIGDYYAEGLIRLLPEGEPQIPNALFNMIRNLREESTEWAYLIHFFIVARIVGIGDEEYAMQRLYLLIDRLKEKFGLIFGSEIEEQLLQLLSLYLISLQEIVEAILSDDPGDMQAEMEAVYESVGNLPIFLSRINPYWDEVKWTELFNTSLGLTIQLGTEMKGKEYVAAMETFEDLLYIFLAMGDYFALGMYQFGLLNGETPAP